jgi:FK506-binding protein 4/5
MIKGLDEGMKKGENAVFNIPPELACGASVSPQTIPPNATLQFYVKEGEKWEHPKDPDEVLGNFLLIGTLFIDCFFGFVQLFYCCSEI